MGIQGCLGFWVTMQNHKKTMEKEWRMGRYNWIGVMCVSYVLCLSRTAGRGSQ